MAGITLKAARVNAGLTQEQAAEALGISKDSLSNYERGKTFPDVPVIEKIIKLYAIEYKDLVFSCD